MCRDALLLAGVRRNRTGLLVVALRLNARTIPGACALDLRTTIRELDELISRTQSVIESETAALLALPQSRVGFATSETR